MGNSLRAFLGIGVLFLLGACGTASLDPSKYLNSGGGTTASGPGSDSGLSVDDEDEQDNDATHDGGTLAGNRSGSGADGGVISRIRPALAIRASGCILCHGQVEANIITDFG